MTRNHPHVSCRDGPPTQRQRYGESQPRYRQSLEQGRGAGLPEFADEEGLSAIIVGVRKGLVDVALAVLLERALEGLRGDQKRSVPRTQRRCG